MNQLYLNGFPPQPAIAVKTLGIKSLAGLTPNPAFIPKLVPRVRTIIPIKSGAKFEPGPIFLLSNNANMVPTKSAVPSSYRQGKYSNHFVFLFNHYKTYSAK